MNLGKSHQLISEAQAKQFFAIAKNAGYSKGAIKALLVSKGFQSSRGITKAKYDNLCANAQDAELAKEWNQKAWNAA